MFRKLVPVVALALMAASVMLSPARGVEAPMAFAARPLGTTGGEPTFGVLADGTILYQSSAQVMRSRDEGQTWTRVLAAPLGLTLDAYLHVDQPSGTTISSQLYAACQLLSSSTDGGDSWLTAPTQCATVDHQKLGSGPVPSGSPLAGVTDRLVYTCSNRVGDTACAVSVDHGRTWGPLVTVFPGYDPSADTGLNGAPGACGGLEGDPVSGPDGTIYIPREYCGRPFVGISRDGGLTWVRQAVASPARTLPVGYGANNPAVTVDAAGHVFYAWTGNDWRHHVARSDDGGITWTDLGPVSPAGGSTTFPLIIAGRDGAVATAYLGTTDTDRGPDAAPATARWSLFVAYTTDGGSATPTWTTVEATPSGDPVMIGCISRHGSGCTASGHSGLLDFNDIELLPDGRVAISYADACPQCTSSATSRSSDAYLAVQTAGPHLL